MRTFRFDKEPEAHRFIFVDEGGPYLLETLGRQADEDGPTSLAGMAIANGLKLRDGNTYVEAPFDCPEDLALLDFGASPFEVKDGHDSEAYREFGTVSLTHSAFLAQVKSRSSWVISELGRYPDNYDGPTNVDPPTFEVDGVHYRFACHESSADVIQDVLIDITPRFVFLVKAPPQRCLPGMIGWSTLLDICSASH